ncbi:universal stress protein [uncultured Eudoraea sp.]|uniref:universal stress protein n=1 Tax=uncultured Eudoraea sp. TaxID=1035614 RepID=UPI00262EBF28|nr:universal stress protein [uncultured Eudoraea sp.]
MKTILYATDYSTNSISAIKLADVFRNKLDAQLHIIHVFDISATFISTVSLAYAKLEEAAFKDNREKLELFCREHLEKFDDDDTKPMLHVVENSIESVGIIEKAEEINADLIVVGMRGRNIVRDLFIGSTATALIEKSPVPVLTVPQKPIPSGIKNIIYATAFEEVDVLAIDKISEFAATFDAEIKLIHVSTKNEYAAEDQMLWFKEMLKEKVSNKNISFEFRSSEDVFNTLKEFLLEVDVDILVMLEREGNSLIPNLWHFDLVKRMKLEHLVPLLSFQKNSLQLSKKVSSSIE